MAKEQKKKNKSRTNGEGSFYFDKSKKRWYGVLTVGFDTEDRPIRKKVSDKDRKTALDKYNELKDQVHKGTYVDKNDNRLEDIIIYQLEKDKSLNIINDNTYMSRKYILQVIQNSKIGKTPIQLVDETMLLVFFNTVTHYSQSYIRKIYRCINAAFKYAQSKEIIYRNPLDQIKTPKSHKETKNIAALTIDEQKQFISVLHNEERNNKYRFIFELMLNTGMRCGEVNALDVSDINFNFNRITIRRTITRDMKGRAKVGKTTKTKNGQRFLIMTSACCKSIQSYLDSQWQANRDNMLFYDFEADKLLTTNQVNLAFQHMIRKYEIIPVHKEYRLLSEKGKKKIAYRKYTFFRKLPDGSFERLPKEPPKDWERNFGKYYYIADIPERPYNVHMLRHTFATRCIESGMPAKVLQKILGHADVQTTLNTYCDVFEEYENEAMQNVEEYMKKTILTS